MKRKIILISGGTASGKSMIADILYEQYIKDGKTATLMNMDNYYISLDKLGENKIGENVNWDSPDVIDWKQFIIDVKKLENGENIYKSSYDFKTYSHKDEVEYISNEFIIIEGLFSLFEEKIREISSLRIFVEAGYDTRLMRRVERDKTGRYKETFDNSHFLKKWKTEIKPMHKKHIQPTSEYANSIIYNDKEFLGNEKEKIINSLKSIMIK